MSKKVRWGVISTANIGTAKVIPGMKRAKNLEITAISCRSLDQAQKAAKKLSIPKAYGSYDEILRDKDIDAVYIPLPNHLSRILLTNQRFSAKFLSSIEKA